MSEELKPWIERFGTQPDSWNAGCSDDDESSDNSGYPGIGVIRGALDAWQRSVGSWNAQEAAMVFNLPLTMVAEAAPRPFVVGDEPDSDELAQAIATMVTCRGALTSVAFLATAFAVYPADVLVAVGKIYLGFVFGDKSDFTKLFVEIDGE